MDNTLQFPCPLFDFAEVRERPILLIHAHEEPDKTSPSWVKTFQIYEYRNLCDFIVYSSLFIDEANEAQRGKESHPESHRKLEQEHKSPDSYSHAYSELILYLLLWLLGEKWGFIKIHLKIDSGFSVCYGENQREKDQGCQIYVSWIFIYTWFIYTPGSYV